MQEASPVEGICPWVGLPCGWEKPPRHIEPCGFVDSWWLGPSTRQVPYEAPLLLQGGRIVPESSWDPPCTKGKCKQRKHSQLGGLYSASQRPLCALWGGSWEGSIVHESTVESLLGGSNSGREGDCTQLHAQACP